MKGDQSNFDSEDERGKEKGATCTAKMKGTGTTAKIKRGYNSEDEQMT